MGSRMAVNLANSQHQITIWNRSEVDKVFWKNRKVDLASSIQEAVSDADVVISMLSTPEAVSQVGLSNGGILDSLSEGKIWIDCSTVDPNTSRELAKESSKLNIHFVDAPVAGSAPQAEAAELVFFLGGDVDVIDNVRPLLDHMGKKQIHLGVNGMGSSFKMLVNAMLGQSMAIFSETVAFGQSMGLERDFLLETLPKLVVSAPFIQFKVPQIKSEEYAAQFPLEWMHKDLELATRTAYEVGQPLYLANVTKEIFSAAKQAGLGRKDFSAVYSHIERSMLNSK